MLNFFRQFIAGVLKTKGLRKALKFLDELYKNVLRKAHITLKDQSIVVNDVLLKYCTVSDSTFILGRR